MKGIYIFSTNDRDYRANGEAKKVLSQVDAFRKAGVDISLYDVILDRKIDKVLYRLPFRGVYLRDFIEKCGKSASGVDFVYIRKNIFDSSYYELLRTIHKSNPKIKVVVEIPTYPYFQEWNRVVDKPLIWKEKRVIPKVTRGHLVDYYLTLTDDREIYGIPTIKFDNCIAVDDYTLKKNLQSADEIHLIGVALLANWHAYDRVIKGLHEYYRAGVGQTKVVFHIVGEGPEYGNLKRLTEQCGVGSHVIFEGRQKGEKLDHLYDISHVGIGSLGMYRIGLTQATSLKLREYCAKGIPFIKGNSDPVFDDYRYCLSFPNDETPIGIQRIVDWTRGIDYTKTVDSMREYAAIHLDWAQYIHRILDRLGLKVE